MAVSTYTSYNETGSAVFLQNDAYFEYTGLVPSGAVYPTSAHKVTSV